MQHNPTSTPVKIHSRQGLAPKKNALVLLSVLGITISLLFALINQERGLRAVSAMETVAALIYLANLIYLRRRVSHVLPSIIGLGVTAILLVIVTHASGMHAMFWIYTLPLLGFYLLGLSGGIIMNTLMAIFFGVYMINFSPRFVRLDFIEMDILLSYIVVAGLALYYEMQRHDHVRRLEHASSTDPLTGIYNRRKFGELFSAELDRAARYRLPLSLIIFDVDYFKQINDSNGHSGGDAILREITGLVGEHIRSNDYLGRFGGDEFMILTPQTDLEQAARLGEKLQELIASHRFAVTDATVTISVGVTDWRQGEGLDQVIARADRALYQAKAGGRNTTVAHKRSIPPPMLVRVRDGNDCESGSAARY
jgi:diguanylate cyclase (GGDEF)-like protein